MKFLAGPDLPNGDDFRAAADAMREFLAEHTEPAPRPWRTPGEPARDDPPFRSVYQAIEFAWAAVLDGYASKSPGDPHRIARLAAYGGATGAGSVDLGHRHVEAAHAPVRALWRAYTDHVPLDLDERVYASPDVQRAILLLRVLGIRGGRMPLKRLVAELEDRWGLRISPKRAGHIARAGLLRVYADLRHRNLVPVDHRFEEEDDVQHDLRGWGEIATYLGVSERAARRYADKLGLPVRKFVGMVVARRAAIDAWRTDITRDRRP